jgi:hypothetical protein
MNKIRAAIQLPSFPDHWDKKAIKQWCRSLVRSIDDRDREISGAVNTAIEGASEAYVDAADSALQSAIDGKQAIIVGAATTVVNDNLAVSRAVVSNSSGKIAVSSVTDIEIGQLSGVTSNIQDQIDAISWSTYNILSYGAVMDGVTDDSEAVQDAIDAAATAGGGIVIIPEGSLVIDATVYVKTNVTVRGAGRNATKIIRTASGASGAVFEFLGVIGDTDYTINADYGSGATVIDFTAAHPFTAGDVVFVWGQRNAVDGGWVNARKDCLGYGTPSAACRFGEFVLVKEDTDADTITLADGLIFDTYKNDRTEEGIPITSYDAGTDIITLTAHPFVDDDGVWFFGTIGGLTSGDKYYIRDKTTNTFKLCSTPGGSAIDITGTGGSGGLAPDASTRAATTFRAVTWISNAHLQEFSVEVQRVVTQAIRANWAKECSLSNIDFLITGTNNGGFFRGFACYRSWAERCRAYHANRTYTTEEKTANIDYRWASSQDCEFTSCSAFNGTQGFDLTYVSGYMPTINCGLVNCYTFNHVDTGMTAHPGTFLNYVIGGRFVKCREGLAIRGRKSVIVGNVCMGFHTWPTDFADFLANHKLNYGVALYEGWAQESVIQNNQIRGFANGISILDAADSGECWEEINSLIQGNSIDECFVGIYRYSNEAKKTATAYSGLIITDNVISRAARGIWLENWTACPIIHRNTVIGPLLYGTASEGIYLEDECPNADVQFNTLINLGTAHTGIDASTSTDASWPFTVAMGGVYRNNRFHGLYAAKYAASNSYQDSRACPDLATREGAVIMTDGIAEPDALGSTRAGIYVHTTDGALKVKFGSDRVRKIKDDLNYDIVDMLYTDQTTDATPENVMSMAIPTNSIRMVEAVVVGLKSDRTAGAAYRLKATFRNNGGTTVQIGATTVDVLHEDNAAWDAAFTVSSPNIILQVTGVAATTINWKAFVETYSGT